MADERFRPQGQDDLAPSGQVARIRANLEALRTLRTLQTQGRSATAAEQSVLARWSSWGAVPNVFLEDRDPATGELTEASKQFEWARTELRELLFEGEYEAARRTTINAHYTDAGLVGAIWQGLGRFGFEGGRVLEPGCGSGHFIGMAPGTASMVGVELDPITGGIAAALYPDADVRIESFADTRIREGAYDAAVGNVPFAKVALNDRRYNPDRRYSMHSHFILKSLHAVRPGGMVALLTSRYTMDAGNDPESAAADARREMAEIADLVTAVRLPAGAHRRAAGTDVVTDLLVLRRREPDRDPAPVDWQKVVTIDIDGAPVEVNQYFADHPEQILGTLTTGRGQFNDHELTVRADPDIDVADALAEVLETAASRAAKTDLLMSPPEVPIEERLVRRASDLTIHGAEADRFEGLIVTHDDGTFSAVRDGETEPFAVPASQADELRVLLGLRDAVTALLDAEAATTEDTDDIAELRARLNERYDAYIAAYGPINRFTWSPRIRDTDEGRELREQLLAEGHATYRGGTFVLHEETAADLARRDELLAQEHAVLKDGKLRMRQTKAAKEVRARLLAEGHAHIEGGTFTLTDTGRAIAASAPAAAVNRVATFPPQGGFRTDPYAPAVLALEDFDADTGTARKAAIFFQRVIAQRKPTERTDDPADAVAISRDVLGRVDIDYVTLLLGEDSPETARTRLGELVFDEPGTGQLIPRSEYLSGNVRTKLAKAEDLAELDEKFQTNVAALRSVLPPDLDAGDIDARLGSPWIDAAVVQQGLREILEDNGITVSRGVGASWTIEGGNKHSVMATDVYGTKERNAIELAHALLEGRPIRVNAVFDSDDTPQSRQRKAQWAAGETAVAQAKAEELNNAFTEWLWDDPQRSAELAATYNFKFNSLVSRTYDDARPALPGLTAAGEIKTPRPHQLAAVARIVSEPTALLAHEVGAGKTLEMVMGAMELRRLGMARKPTIVVPNHMLEQFSREFLQAYPQARILAVGKKDLTKDKRRRTVARIATGDWDAVIMSRSVFERIPMSAERQKRYIDHQLEKLDAWLARQPPGSNKKMVKRMEAKRLAREEALKKRLESAKDSGISFEQTGIDYLFIDEAHGYKNLSLPSNNQELAIDGSGRATDLDMKLDYLREAHGQRVATFATATPISNSMSEMFIMLQYLRPDLLADAGLDDFDSWVANHGEVVSDVEVSPEGGVRVKGRFARYRNVPELLRMFHTFADVKTAADLNLPVPALIGDAPEVVVVPASFEQHQFMAELSDRAEQVRNRRVHPSEDNLLKISSDGRAAALDLRLVERESDSPGKLDLAAERIAGIWAGHRDDVFYTKGENGERVPEEIKGSLQLVFCDLGTPKEGRTSRNANEYESVRAKLYAAGVAEGTLAELDEMFHASLPPEQQAWEDLHDRLWDAVGLTEDDIGTSVGPNADAKALFTRVVAVFNERSALRRSGDWSAYGELKDQLVARGIPAEQIRFMQEAKTDQDKADLFAAARAGKVSVLIGSTELMGVGTNVQRRAVALHHLDCPWRPADVDQREGRIRRQGNQHDAVQIIRYVTEGSFDAYMWQTVERKQKFIAQVMKGKLDTRDMEAIDESALSYSEVKALASGDMRLLAKAKVDQEVQKLERLESSHRRSQQSMRGRIQAGEAAITALTAKLDNITTALDRRIDTRGDAFSMRLGPQTFSERPKAAATLIDTIRQEVVLAGVNPDGTLQPLGTIGGFDLSIAVHDREVSLILHGVPEGTVRLPIRDLPRDEAPVGLITRLENKLAGLEKVQATTTADIERATAEVERAKANLGKPFPHTEALAQARAEAAKLSKELGAESRGDDPNTEDANGEGTSGTTLSPEDAAAFSGIANAFASSTAAEPEPQPDPSDSVGITAQTAEPETEPASRLEPPSIADLEPVNQGYQDADQIRTAYAAINAAMAAFAARPFNGTFAEQHAHRQVTDAIALVTARDGMGTRAGAYDRFDMLRDAARRFAESVDDPAAETAAALATLLEEHTERARLTPASLEAWHWPPTQPAANTALEADQDTQPARSDSVGIAAGPDEPAADQPAQEPAPQTPDSTLTPGETAPNQPVAEPQPDTEAATPPASAAEAPAAGDPQQPAPAPAAQPYDQSHIWDAADRLLDLRNEVVTTGAYEAMEIDDRDGLARRFMARWGDVIRSARQGLPQHVEATRQALAATRDVIRAVDRYYDPGGARRLLNTLVEQTERHLARLDATQAAAPATPEPDVSEPAPATAPAEPEAPQEEQHAATEPDNPIIIEHNRTTTLVHRTRKEDLAVRKALSNNGFRWSSNIGDEGAWYLPRPWKYHTRDNRVSRLRRDLERLGTTFVVQTTPPTPQTELSPTVPAPAAEAAVTAEPTETIQADQPPTVEEAAAGSRNEETTPRTAELTDEQSTVLVSEPEQASDSVGITGQAEGAAADRGEVDAEAREDAAEPQPLDEEGRDGSPTQGDLLDLAEPPAAEVEDAGTPADLPDDDQQPAPGEPENEGTGPQADAPAAADAAQEGAPAAAEPEPEQARTIQESLELLPGEEYLGYAGRFDGDYDLSIPGGRYVFRMPNMDRMRYSVRFMPDTNRGWETERIGTTDDLTGVMPLVRQHARRLAEPAAYEENTLRTAEQPAQQTEMNTAAQEEPDASAKPQQAADSVGITTDEETGGRGEADRQLRSDELEVQPLGEEERDNGPEQGGLFAVAEPVAAEPGEAEELAALLDDDQQPTPTEPETEDSPQVDLPAAETAQEGTPGTVRAPEPERTSDSVGITAGEPQTAEEPPGPLTDDDIRVALRTQVSGWKLANLVRALDDPDSLRTWMQQQAKSARSGYVGNRRDDAPGAPAHDQIDETRRGIRHRVATPDGRREGTITWKQAAERVRAVMTPDLARALIEVYDATRAQSRAGDLDTESSVQLGRQLREASEAIHDAIDAAGPPSHRRAGRSSRQRSGQPEPEQGDLFAPEGAPEPSPSREDATTPAQAPDQDASEPQEPGPAADSIGIDPEPPAIPAPAEPELSGTEGEEAEEVEHGLDGNPDAEYDEEEDYELLYPEEFELTAPEPPTGTAAPLTETDIAFAVRNYLDPWGVVEATAGALGDPVTMERWVERGTRHSGGSANVLPEGHPDAGSSVSMGMRRNGLYAHVFAANGSRKGTIPWADILGGVREALTTERVNVLFAAENAHRALWDDWKFAIDDPEGWESQNRQVEQELIAAARMILDALRMPKPGSRPPRSAVRPAQAEPTLFEIDEVQPLEGTIALRPRSEPRYKAPAEVEAGDMLIHHGYAGGPFIVREIAHRGGSTVLTGEVYYIGRPPFREPWSTDATMVIGDDLDERMELAPARLDQASAQEPEPEAERQQEIILTQETGVQVAVEDSPAPEPQPVQEPAQEAAASASSEPVSTAIDVASTTPSPEESTTPPEPAEASDSVGIASAQGEAVPSREGTPVAEEPQQLALAVPVAPVLPQIDEPTYEAAIARADAAVDALRTLWRIGPGALGFPDDLNDAIRAAWQQAGQQATARADEQRRELADAFQAVQAEAENAAAPAFQEPELPAEAEQGTAADAQPGSDESRNAAYLADYRAGRPPRDEAAAEAYREWRQLDAEDQEAALEALDLENEYERYQGPLSWSEWLQQRDDPEFDATEEPSPEESPQQSANALAERGEEDRQEPTSDGVPRSDSSPETAQEQEAGSESDEPQPVVEPEPAVTAEDERAETTQTPVEATADAPERDDQQQDAGDDPEGEGTVTDQQEAAIAGADERDRAEDFFGQVNAVIDQLRADLDDALAEEPAEQNGQGDPLAAFTDALAQLGVEVDPPGTEPPAPDLGLDGLTEVEQAYTAASRHAREYNGAPEWRQLNQLWQSTQRVWANAREVLARYGADLATDIRWHGMLRTVGIRAAEGVARLSNRLAERLSGAGRNNSPGHRALQGLSRAAQNFAARLRGHNPTERFAAFDSLAESIRDLRADLTRGPDQPQTQTQAEGATAPGQPTATRPQDFDAFRLVGEAFDGAGRHAREYNGAPEWRRLTTVWPTATRVLGEHRAAAVARYGADLATDIRWRGIERTAAIRSLDTVARLSNRLAERLSNAGRHDSPGYRAIQALGHAAQRAASALRGEDPTERAERVAAFDRLTESIRDLRADLAQVSLDDDGPDRGGDGPGPGGIPFGEPARPTLQTNGQTADQQAENGPGPGGNAPATRPALTGTRPNGPGLGE